VSGAALRGPRLDVTVVQGGHPDAATLAAIEQAVASVLTAPLSDAASRMPAWGRAARLEAAGTQRILSRLLLARTARG